MEEKLEETLLTAAKLMSPEDNVKFLSQYFRNNATLKNKANFYKAAANILENKFPKHALQLWFQSITYNEKCNDELDESYCRKRFGLIQGLIYEDQSNLRYKPWELINQRYKIYFGKSGGMGEVYFCMDIFNNEPIVLKIPLESNPYKVQFEDESLSWIMLGKHPNIVQAYRADVVPSGAPIIITEYVVGPIGMGETLRSWLQKQIIDLELSIDLMIQFCYGMEHIDRNLRNMIHRDIKPENILIDYKKTLKITDWGLANVSLPSYTMANFIFKIENEEIVIDGSSYQKEGRIPHDNLVGTIQYMSPEQIKKEPLDVRSDIYSFGCVMYEIVTRRRLFEGLDDKNYLNYHLYKVPLSPKEQSLNTPEILNKIIMKSLEKNPYNRYANFGDLKNDLIIAYKEILGKEYNYIPKLYSLTNNEKIEHCISMSMLGRNKEALEYIERILESDPKNSYAIFAKSRILSELMKIDEAIACLQNVINIDPNRSEAWFNLGVSYLKISKDIDKAKMYIQKALELGHPRAKEVLNSLNNNQIIIIT